jgi:hypothetical protein
MGWVGVAGGIGSVVGRGGKGADSDSHTWTVPEGGGERKAPPALTPSFTTLKKKKNVKKTYGISIFLTIGTF